MHKRNVVFVSMAALVITIGTWASAQEPVVVEGSKITNLVRSISPAFPTNRSSRISMTYLLAQRFRDTSTTAMNFISCCRANGRPKLKASPNTR